MKRLLVLCIALTLPLFGFAATAITMVTSHGTIELELDEQRAPITVENFLNYVNSGYYNGTIFHRIIPNFMVQGGGFTPDMNQKDTVGQIENEAKNGLTNARGTIAMCVSHWRLTYVLLVRMSVAMYFSKVYMQLSFRLL